MFTANNTRARTVPGTCTPIPACRRQHPSKKATEALVRKLSGRWWGQEHGANPQSPQWQETQQIPRIAICPETAKCHQSPGKPRPGMASRLCEEPFPSVVRLVVRLILTGRAEIDDHTDLAQFLVHYHFAEGFHEVCERAAHSEAYSA